MQQATGAASSARITVRLFTAAFLFGVAFPAMAADTLEVGIDNFGQINQNYYRGAQPDQASLRKLKELGVKTIIDLQEKGLREEAQWVRDAGMQYFKIPLSSTHPASAAETEYFLKLVSAPENWPVFVHCAGGRHRTGEMTAIYRITYDSWTADEAYQEMKKFRYYSFGGHGSLRDHVYNYYQNHEATRAAQQEIVPQPAASAKPALVGATP